jgi:hypothetical protein
MAMIIERWVFEMKPGATPAAMELFKTRLKIIRPHRYRVCEQFGPRAG